MPYRQDWEWGCSVSVEVQERDKFERVNLKQKKAAQGRPLSRIGLEYDLLEQVTHPPPF